MKEKNSLYPRFSFPLPLLLDGATGTNLSKAGMPAGIMPEKWILDHPDVILSLQKEYARFSDMIYAPTFGANRPTMERHGERDVEGFNRRLAALTREAAGKKLVAGDLSPTGLILAPYGDTDFDEVAAVYAEQAKALDDTVDLFVSETNLSLAEACAAVEGVKSVSDKPVFVTVTVDGNGRTMSGDKADACLLTLADRGVSAFGLNCSCGPESMSRFLLPLLPLSVALGVPLIAKPNAGVPHTDADGHTSFSLSPDDFARDAEALLSGGIAILGGCCGSEPAHIAALRNVIDTFDGPFPVPSPISDLSRTICTNTTLAEAGAPETLTPIPVNDDMIDDACDMGEEYGYAFVSLQAEEDAEELLHATPYIPYPFVVTGEKKATELFRRKYPGKLLIR